ncbi:MAG TPA: hypothetical protein IGR64_08290 [Leptolyngbyaceae cyanobacterium M65_K2018_010]|nr:hypothetical protein [Leptolyngbyaceae cyanobacterium M65_K2018_010]
MPDIELPAAEDTVSTEAETLYTYEQTAELMAISVTLVQRFVALNLLEPQQAKLRDRDLNRIAKMLRLRRDLGLNWVGASMVLDMCEEIAQLKARLRAYGAHLD